MTWSARQRAVTLQLGLAALVAGFELAAGPTLPPRPNQTPSSQPLGQLVSAAVCAAETADSLQVPVPWGAGRCVADDSAWREILELRREHGSLLNGAIWQVPDTPAADGAAPSSAAGWEEAAFGQALRHVMDAAAPR